MPSRLQADAPPWIPTMSEPDITNTSFAMASQMAATARIAPAMMAIPLPMKSRVTVAFDIGRFLSIDGWVWVDVVGTVTVRR